jgi:hypothetical protein
MGTIFPFRAARAAAADVGIVEADRIWSRLEQTVNLPPSARRSTTIDFCTPVRFLVRPQLLIHRHSLPQGRATSSEEGTFRSLVPFSSNHSILATGRAGDDDGHCYTPLGSLRVPHSLINRGDTHENSVYCYMAMSYTGAWHSPEDDHAAPCGARLVTIQPSAAPVRHQSKSRAGANGPLECHREYDHRAGMVHGDATPHRAGTGRRGRHHNIMGREMKGRYLALFFLRVVLGTSALTALLHPYASLAATQAQWVGRAVSVQGTVEAQRVGDTQWQPVRLNDTFRAGDQIRVRDRSRADVAMLDQSVLRLNANTTITVQPVKEERTGVVDLIRGAVHFL